MAEEADRSSIRPIPSSVSPKCKRPNQKGKPMPLVTKIADYVFKGNAKPALTSVPLHPASPLITADEELNPLVNGAVPDYKATAIALAETLLTQHNYNQALDKAHSNTLKDLMVLVGVVQSLRPVVKAIRDNPILWAFVPKDLRQGIDLVLRMVLPHVDQTEPGQPVYTDSKFRPL